MTVKDLQSTPNVKTYFKEYFTKLLRDSPKQQTQKSRKVPIHHYGEVLASDEVLHRMESLEIARKVPKPKGTRTRKAACYECS